MPDNPTNSKRRSAPRKTIEVRQTDDYGHLQPQAPELERAVLGALMLEEDSYSRISEILQPESFYEVRNQKLFNAIRTLAANQHPIDTVTVCEQLRRSGDFEEVGGMPYIMQLTADMKTSAHIEYHAKIIAQKALARQLITFSCEVQADAFDEMQDVDDLMQRAEANLFKISQQNMKKDYVQIAPVVGEALEILKKAASRTTGLTGLASGFYDLDKMTSGWQNSDLIIIAARPAMGKTAFVLSMAKNIAIVNREPIAVFSLEMSNVQLVTVLSATSARFPETRLRAENLPMPSGKFSMTM